MGSKHLDEGDLLTVLRALRATTQALNDMGVSVDGLHVHSDDLAAGRRARDLMEDAFCCRECGRATGLGERHHDDCEAA